MTRGPKWGEQSDISAKDKLGLGKLHFSITKVSKRPHLKEHFYQVSERLPREFITYLDRQNKKRKSQKRNKLYGVWKYDVIPVIETADPNL